MAVAKVETRVRQMMEPAFCNSTWCHLGACRAVTWGFFHLIALANFVTTGEACLRPLHGFDLLRVSYPPSCSSLSPTLGDDRVKAFAEEPFPAKECHAGRIPRSPASCFRAGAWPYWRFSRLRDDSQGLGALLDSNQEAWGWGRPWWWMSCCLLASQGGHFDLSNPFQVRQGHS